MPASIRKNNLLLKDPTFFLSSTSLPTSSQCSRKTSPSLSIWATCPSHGGSFLLPLFLSPGQLLKNKDVNKHDGYIGGSLSTGQIWAKSMTGVSFRFVKTWLITALVNFHAMRGDMTDEARDSISSEEVTLSCQSAS